MTKKLQVKIIEPRIPKYCICPVCGLKQTFKKKGEHWKTIKKFDLDKPILLKVLVISDKCLNPHCKAKSFPLLLKRITKYQRATIWLIKEAIASNILG